MKGKPVERSVRDSRQGAGTHLFCQTYDAARARARCPKDGKTRVTWRASLKWVATSGVETAPRGAAGKIGKFRWEIVWLAITPPAIALAIAATYYVTRPATECPLVASVSPPPGVFADTSGRIGPPQISPDGTRLAFIGCKTESAVESMLGGNACSIWLRPLASSDAHEVNDTNGAYYPFWSPDGREIGFFADGKLKRVSVDGSPIQSTAESFALARQKVVQDPASFDREFLIVNALIVEKMVVEPPERPSVESPV